MPVTVDNSGLVAGVVQPAFKTTRIKLGRAICIGGKRIEPGTTIDVDRQLAAMLIGANKAERAPEETPKPAPVQTAPVEETQRAQRVQKKE